MKINEYNIGNEKKILCLPGLYMNGECFEGLAKELKEYHLICITYDSFHYGSEEFQSLEEQSDKIIRLLKEKGTTEFVLTIGTSLGTVFASHLAATSDLSLGKLWLDGGVMLFPYKAKFFYSMAIYSIFHQIMVETKKGSLDVKFLGSPMPKEWLRRTKEPRSAMSEQALKNVTHVLVNYQMEEGIGLPIYMTFGEKEGNIRPNVRYVKSLYPNTIATVEKGYQDLEFMDAKPAEYAARVRWFIKK